MKNAEENTALMLIDISNALQALVEAVEEVHDVRKELAETTRQLARIAEALECLATNRRANVRNA